MAIDSNINKSLNTQRAISEKLIRPTVTNNITDVNQGSNSLAVTSTNIIIKANGIAIGLIQNFSISENRDVNKLQSCLLYTSPSPRDKRQSRMPSSA